MGECHIRTGWGVQSTVRGLFKATCSMLIEALQGMQYVGRSLTRDQLLFD